MSQSCPGGADRSVPAMPSCRPNPVKYNGRPGSLSVDILNCAPFSVTTLTQDKAGSLIRNVRQFGDDAEGRRTGYCRLNDLPLALKQTNTLHCIETDYPGTLRVITDAKQWVR